MRITLFLAPLCVLTACASGTGTTNDPQGADGYYYGKDTGPPPADLTNGYADCTAALVGLGFEPWANAEQDGMIWGIYLTDEHVNTRPWVATMSFTDESPGYRITCGQFQSDGAVMNADPTQAEYTVCAFQGDFIGIMDPASDPDCTTGFEPDAARGDVRYTLQGPGLFVCTDPTDCPS